MQRVRVETREAMEPAPLDEAIRVLATGGLLLFPTETLYGLGCNPRDLAALSRLYRLKRRPASRRLPFVASDRRQVEALVRLEGARATLLADRFWPGPLTLVLPRRPDAPLAEWDWGPTLAVRVPGSLIARELARRFGTPLPATSANLSGEIPPADPAAIDAEILQGVDLLLDAGALPPSLPSSVVQPTEDGWRLLRHGAIGEAELIALLGPPIPGGLRGEG